ncbi:hypothetical protein CSA37_00580 [Candidatus Fermentibacteria bacterium]|nr:MAG: hypothetical protein CSA37_09810 [Candidatus Fermentibacteria bacterium]PIE53694.1 MAG: hypothetical protein CSA37_00580 [Candidatus Fermentibacteria bacterium]
MGKGRVRNSETAKAAILRAAEELFAERGFSGVSISSIAERSGSSGPLIMFHFRSKKGLYSAVKKSIMDRYCRHLVQKPSEASSFRSFLQDILEGMISFYKLNPSLVKLSKWSMLEGECEPWPGEADWHHLYLERIEQARQRGEIRGDISPFRFMVIITGAVHFWCEYHDHFLHDLGYDNKNGEEDEKYIAELESLLLNGLLADTQAKQSQ